MCELTLDVLSVHYITDHSVPCQLWCLVAFGIYDIFPNFLTLLLVLVREMKHKKFFLLAIICDLSRRRIFKCQRNAEKDEAKVLEIRILHHFGFSFLNEVFTGVALRIGPCSAWKKDDAFLFCSPFLELKACFYFSEPPSYYFEHDEPNCALLHRCKSDMIPLGWIKSCLI